MKTLIAAIILTLSLCSITSFAHDKMMSNDMGMHMSSDDTAMMAKMSGDMMMMKQKMMARKMMSVGMKMYMMGKMMPEMKKSGMMTNKNMDPKMMMMMGARMVIAGKMMNGGEMMMPASKMCGMSHH